MEKNSWAERHFPTLFHFGRPIKAVFLLNLNILGCWRGGGTLHIFCLFDFYLTHVLLFNFSPPHLFVQLVFKICPLILQFTQLGGVGQFIVSTNNFKKK
jgi:hypothetical protein